MPVETSKYWNFKYIWLGIIILPSNYSTLIFPKHMLDSASDSINDRWILSRRPPKNSVDPTRPYAFLVEKERTAAGNIEDFATIFLANRECPFRCLMCDLWKNTTDRSVPLGAIPAQIRWALERASGAKHVKLYNSGNFFDAKAIPPADLPVIADLLSSFKTIIIENHPRLVDQRVLDFQDLLEPQLEVAMGLETVHEAVLQQLNKRMTLADFERAAQLLTKNAIRVRAFILLRPPFLDENEGIHWAKRSIDFAFDVGVECCAMIPTRSGNGALDTLRKRRLFSEPRLDSLEEVLDYGISLQRGRVLADLWDLERFSGCDACFQKRAARLHAMNLQQNFLPRVECDCQIS